MAKTNTNTPTIASDLTYKRFACDKIPGNIAFARITDPKLNKAYTEGFEAGVETLMALLRVHGVFVPVTESDGKGGKVQRFIPAHMKGEWEQQQPKPWANEPKRVRCAGKGCQRLVLVGEECPYCHMVNE